MLRRCCSDVEIPLQRCLERFEGLLEQGREAASVGDPEKAANVNRAVWVPLVNPDWIDFVSRRVRNYQADPNLGLIADQVSLAR